MTENEIDQIKAERDAWKKAVTQARQQIEFHSKRAARHQQRAITTERKLAQIEHREPATWAQNTN